MRLMLFLALAGCGGAPVLSHVPKPNPVAAAGFAAALAGAATLADPGGAARLKAESDVAPEKKAVDRPHESIPDDVFDRMRDASGG